MKVLIVYCHPEPASFNGALKEVAADTMRRLGHTVEVSDLHGERFDPVEKADHYPQRKHSKWFSAMAEQRHASETSSLPPDVRREIARLERADLVVLQFPLWWHSQPAMLKGWFDRVFVSGGLYTSTMRYDQGYFRGKRAICSVTTGAPEAAFDGIGRGGNMDTMLWPIHYSLYYMGFTVLPPFLSHGIQGLSGFVRLGEDQFKQHAEQQKANWAGRLERLDSQTPLSFPGWKDWDKDGHQPRSSVDDRPVAGGPGAEAGQSA